MEAIERPRVFVTNFAGHDFSKAEQYGELVYITKGYISFQSLDRVKFRIAEKVLESSKDDWLCLSGTPLISVLAALVWFNRHNVVKLLVWDKKGEGAYREMIITNQNLDTLQSVLTDGA